MAKMYIVMNGSEPLSLDFGDTDLQTQVEDHFNEKWQPYVCGDDREHLEKAAKQVSKLLAAENYQCDLRVVECAFTPAATVTAADIRTLRLCVDTISGYGQFRQGQDGWAAVERLRGIVKKLEVAAVPSVGDVLTRQDQAVTASMLGSDLPLGG